MAENNDSPQDSRRGYREKMIELMKLRKEIHEDKTEMWRPPPDPRKLTSRI